MNEPPAPPQPLSVTVTRPPTPAEIAVVAYSIWEKEGRPEGRELEHWLRAAAACRQTHDLESTQG